MKRKRLAFAGAFALLAANVAWFATRPRDQIQLSVLDRRDPYAVLIYPDSTPPKLRTAVAPPPRVTRRYRPWVDYRASLPAIQQELEGQGFRRTAGNHKWVSFKRGTDEVSLMAHPGPDRRLMLSDVAVTRPVSGLDPSMVWVRERLGLNGF